ncbi:DNA-binding protein [Chitinivorax sp. PXF-14]|uniref:DNA-binding protein n=1 Tax=Chitinivorax sp. PXF-14 TaxID=3230488 RepID=UPI003466BD3B
MSGVDVKPYYGAAELAGMVLPGLPRAVKNVIAKANRDAWAFRPRSGRGGGVEYAFDSLPAEVQATIKQRAAAQLLASRQALDLSAAPPVRRNYNGTQLELPLTDKDLSAADARKGVLLAIERLQAVTGCTLEAALVTLVTRAQAGEVEPMLMAQLKAGRDPRGKVKSELPSVRTLKRWLAASKRNDLVPKRNRPDESLPPWAKALLDAYRKPSKPTVETAWRELCVDIELGLVQLPDGCAAPSIHQARRLLKRLPADLLYRGRHTGAALKALLPYVKRDWSVMRPNDVWVGDGHGLKAKVAHPDHGKPFVPEVTLVLDGASRMIVGWSLSLSENQIAVGDAIRFAVKQYGKALIYYSDNGAGQTAKTLDDPLLGCLPRLGIHHETGIPGNPQGRGIVERAHQTVLLRLAEQFSTFHGKKMDRETVRKRANAIDSALKRGEVARELPTWNQLIDALEQVVDWYNHEHEHSGLPKVNGRHYTPAAYYAAYLTPECVERPDDIELRDLFRPYVLRTPDRGWVKLWNNEYFARELSAIPAGEQVRVGYDIHDAAHVIIRTLDGEFICLAEWSGNKRAAFPVANRDYLHQKRVERITRKALGKVADAEAELAGNYTVPALTVAESIVIPTVGEFKRAELVAAEPADTPQAQQQDAEVVELVTPEQKLARWLALDGEIRLSGEIRNDEDRRFWVNYQKSPQFKAQKRHLEDLGKWPLAQEV